MSYTHIDRKREEEFDFKHQPRDEFADASSPTDNLLPQENTPSYVSSQTPDVYRKLYTSYSYSYLQLDESPIGKQAVEEIKSAVNAFLEHGTLPDFESARKEMFATQPTAASVDSSRKEVLRDGQELLNSVIPDDILLEENRAMLQALLHEHYFMMYHYMTRYWAVKNKADAVISYESELATCYFNMRTSAELILLVNAKLNDEAESREYEKEFRSLRNKMRHMQPYIPNRFRGMLDKDEEQQDADYIMVLLRRANAIRLCWLWDRIVIELFAVTAHDLLLPITIFADQVSWSLYLFLASIHLTGVLGAYYDALKAQKERDIEAKKVLMAHLKLRRDVIVNDLVWGFANLACCFWLNGFGFPAYFGDLITGLLLGMDLYMCIWRHKDDKKEYESDLKSYNEQMLALVTNAWRKSTNYKYDLASLHRAIQDGNLERQSRVISGLEAKLRYEASDSQISILFWQIKRMHSARKRCMVNWGVQRAKLLSDIIYASSLVLTFSVFCCFYLSVLPISFPTSIVYMGAISLGATTLLWRTGNIFIDCRAISREKSIAEDEYKALLGQFKSSRELNYDLNKQKQLYLQILQKAAEVGYKEDKLFYEKLEASRETANRILIPTALAMIFVYAPSMTAGVPTYVFLLLGALIAAIAVSIFIKKYYKPKDTQWDAVGGHRAQPVLNNDEFESFKKYMQHQHYHGLDKVLSLIKKARTGDNARLFHEENLRLGYEREAGGRHLAIEQHDSHKSK